MPKSKYALLMRLAEEKQEAAAERVNQAQRTLTEATSKLTQLKTFVDEYQQRLTDRGSRGIGIVEWQDFRRFLARLDEAVCTQQQQVDRAAQRFLLERHAWQDAKKSCRTFEKLIAREKERAQREERRQEQKMTDELASRHTWNNSSRHEV